MIRRLLVKVFIFILTISFVGGYVVINSDKKVQRQIQNVLGLSAQRQNLPSTADSFQNKYNGWDKYSVDLPDKTKIELMHPKGWQVSESSDDTDVNVTITSPNSGQFRYIYSSKQETPLNCPEKDIYQVEGMNGTYQRFIDSTYYTNENWYICEYSVENTRFEYNKSNLFSFFNANQSDLDAMDLILGSVKRSGI